MGFFNNIIKQFAKNVSQNIENEIKQTISNSLGIQTQPTNTTTKFSIPEKYNMFPKYEGTLIEKPIETETNKYCRVRLIYKNKLNPEFISTLLQNGFVKGSDVRYDKDNTYIIIENSTRKTEIVYHIKKAF